MTELVKKLEKVGIIEDMTTTEVAKVNGAGEHGTLIPYQNPLTAEWNCYHD